MGNSREKPGAQTPWLEVNQLLKLDERFDLCCSGWEGLLLAPRDVSQLAALLFFLREQQIDFHVQGNGTIALPERNQRVIISARVFSQITLHEDSGVLEVGAGAGINSLHSILFERNHEVNFEGDPLSPSSRSAGGLILSGQTTGLRLMNESFLDSILGVEFVTFDGSQLKWGGLHRSNGVGPALHKMLWGYQSFPGVIVKVILKTYPMPPVRLRLSWTFRNQQELWKCFDRLKRFASTWERLDCVISGHPDEQGYVLAQISGLKEEMADFQKECPDFQQAKIPNDGADLKSYLKAQQLKAYPASITQQLTSGEYFWYHGLVNRGWRLTSIVEKKSTEAIVAPVWKQRLDNALNGRLDEGE